MKDKEIIIVSECNHYKNNGKCRIPHYQQGIKYTCCNCSEWNCYYKQLKQKEQEYEELHSRTASIIYSLTGGRLSYSTYTLEGCEQAYRDQLEIDVERVTKELQEENEILKQEVSKFKQALNEIKNIIKGYCKNMCMAETRETCETCQNTEILDIINKTKE